jgi:hypothetical protein
MQAFSFGGVTGFLNADFILDADCMFECKCIYRLEEMNFRFLLICN